MTEVSRLQLRVTITHAKYNYSMPFTLTHALAVLPAAATWRRLPFSALVIGSFLPDLPMFTEVFSTTPHYRLTHSFVGSFTACLPIGFFFYVIFQFLMKQPLFELLPHGIQRRTSEFRAPFFELTPWFFTLLVLSLLFGTWTHQIWDAFTHQNRWGTKLIPVINDLWWQAWNVDFFGWKVLQHGSSIIGLPIMLAWLAWWLRRRPVKPLEKETHLPTLAKFVVYVLIITLATIAGGYAAATTPMISKYQFVKDIVISVAIGSALPLAAYSTIYQVVFWQHSETRNLR